MKRDWSGMSGLAGLGLSRSMLKTIGSAQSTLGVLDRVGGIGAAARATGTLKAGSGLQKHLDGARLQGIAGMGAGSALSAVSVARKANSSAALGGPGVMGLAGRDLKDALGIGNFSVPDAAKVPGLGQASRGYPARWIVLEDDRAAAYLRVAVYNEADRVERDRERLNRVWWTARDPKTKEKIELRPTLQPDDILELMMKRLENPADIVLPPPDDRGRVLEMLYIEGTEQDNRMVGMIIAGFDLAAIAHAVGWPEVQRFQRKAQRWKIKLDSTSGG